MLDRTAIILLLLCLRRRRRLRSFERCRRCNPRTNKDSENSSDESDGSSYVQECCCSDNETSEPESTSSEEAQHDEAPLKVQVPPAQPADRREPLLQVQQNVIQTKVAPAQKTMRRYPPVTANVPFSFQVRHPAATGQAMCPPVRPSESFTQHMAEIEYWVKTHRPPCTYGMPVPVLRPDDRGIQTVSTVDSKTDTLIIKKPVDPDISPIKCKEGTRKKLFKTIGDEAKPKENMFFASTPESPQRITSKANGARLSVSERKNLIPKQVNGNSCTERKKGPTSTPVTSRSRKVNAGKKSNSVANKSPRSRATSTKRADVADKSKCFAGPSQIVNDSSSRELKPCVVDDSDTSVLTAPYIRSTRNSASKSKCQSLTRQRASQKTEKLLTTRSRTRSQNDKSNLDLSFDMKESSALNNSKVTSESSLDIFGGDLTAEINNSRKSTLRSSSGKKPQTLHFSGLSKMAGTKRRSEPIMTRTSAKRALLSNSCGTAVEQQQNGIGKAGAGSVGETNRSCADESVTADDVPLRKKFFK